MYISPAYADGKIYVATDRRSIYIINATNGERLSWFGTGSNSWSSPSIYEGRVYIGNQDWNLYCLDDSSVTHGQISVEVDKNEVEKGESITGSGQLTPGIAYAPITVTFVKSDGTVENIQVTAQKDGTFSFNYTPDMVGSWAISISCSGAAYIMQSADISINVFEPLEQQTPEPEPSPSEPEQPTPEQDSGIPAEYVTAAAATLIIAVIAVAAYLFMKRKTRSSPVVISG